MSVIDWIRPWYPGHVPVHGFPGGFYVGHIFADCEELLKVRTDVIEGTGWLDPNQPDVCEPCLERHNGDEEDDE